MILSSLNFDYEKQEKLLEQPEVKKGAKIYKVSFTKITLILFKWEYYFKVYLLRLIFAYR